MTIPFAEPSAGISRRTLLQVAAAGGAASVALHSGMPAFAMASHGGGWENGPMRWAHIVFTEDDPSRYDLRTWIDFFRRAHVGGAVLSAGGVAAFYPTRVPYHRRAKYLGSRDMFGEMSKACREELGMRIVARVDPHAISLQAAAENPLWAMRAPDGSIRMHPTAPDLVLACGNGPVTFEWMPRILDEITAAYRTDAIFGNRWGGNAGAVMDICHCEVCRAKFRSFSGLDIPANLTLASDESDAAVATYMRWDDSVRYEQLKLWGDTIAAANPDAFFVPGTLGRLDPDRLKGILRAAFVDRQGRPPQGQIYSFGWVGKDVRSVLPGMPVAGIFAVGEATNTYRFEDSTNNLAETRLYLHDGLAQGLRPSVCKFKAEIFDRRWMPTVEKAFAWHAKNEKYFRNENCLSRVGLIQSAQTATHYDKTSSNQLVYSEGGHYGGALKGWYQALIDSRIVFDLVDDRDLSSQAIDRYRVLILGSIAALSDKQCEQLRAYVARGGRIVATGETSLCDETGNRRANFGLAGLFGCDYAGSTEQAVKNSYLSVRQPHPILVGLDTPRIMNGAQIVHVTAHAPSASPLTLVPPYPDLPMERVYTSQWETTTPMVFARESGMGRVVYFPTDLDRTYWDLGNSDHLLILGNAVRWAADERQPIEVHGPGMLDIAYWRQKASLAAHIVNLTNPMAMRGSAKEIYPIGPLTVDLVLPQDARVAAVTLLESGQPAVTRREGTRLIVEVPRVEVHEVVAVDLA